MLLMVTTLFCLLTTPLAVALIIMSFSLNILSPLAIEIITFLQFTNHSINVLMYLSCSAQFRNQLKKLFCFCCKCRSDASRDNEIYLSTTTTHWIVQIFWQESWPYPWKLLELYTESIRKKRRLSLHVNSTVGLQLEVTNWWNLWQTNRLPECRARVYKPSPPLYLHSQFSQALNLMNLMDSRICTSVEWNLS